MSDKDREQTNLEPEEIEEFSDTDLPADATVEVFRHSRMKPRRGTWSSATQPRSAAASSTSADSVHDAEDARLPPRLTADKEDDGIIPDEIRESERAGTFTVDELRKAPPVPVEEEDPP